MIWIYDYSHRLYIAIYFGGGVFTYKKIQHWLYLLLKAHISIIKNSLIKSI